MRIAYVINSLEGGGAAFPVPAIASALQACGANLAILALTRRDGRAQPAIAAQGIELLVREGGEKDHRAALAWLERAIGEIDADIVWTSLTRATLLGQIAGARRRIPVVSWQHAAFLKLANLGLLRVSQRLSSLWVADSEAVADFTARRIGVRRDRLAIWPIFAADRAAPAARPWGPNEEIRIGSLGRLHAVKGYDVLLRALAILDEQRDAGFPPFQITIGGSGEERATLLEQARLAGIDHLDLAGFVGDPRRFLASCHLYVQPSRSEGFCIAGHEAMQAGLPIISSRVGELANSVQPGVTGWLVPPNDPHALASALAEAIRHPQELHAMGIAGRDRLLERFSPEHFHEGAAAIYERLAALSPAGPRFSRRRIGRAALRRTG